MARLSDPEAGQHLGTLGRRHGKNYPGKDSGSRRRRIAGCATGIVPCVVARGRGFRHTRNILQLLYNNSTKHHATTTSCNKTLQQQHLARATSCNSKTFKTISLQPHTYTPPKDPNREMLGQDVASFIAGNETLSQLWFEEVRWRADFLTPV